MQLVILTTLAVLECSCVSTLALTKYITPNSSMPCPDERYCYGLQEVTHNTRMYFTSNTTLKLLSGKYKIKTESSMVVSDVTGLAIVGSNNTTIQCFENFGLVFLNVSNLTLQHLHFTHCGLNVFSKGLMNIANRLTDVDHLITYKFIPKEKLSCPLHFIQVYDLNVKRVVVDSSKGCGILGINIFGNSSLVYSSFSGNMFNAFTRTLVGISQFLLLSSFQFWQLCTQILSWDSQNPNIQQVDLLWYSGRSFIIFQ